jgi:hypothetical protein
MLTCRKRAVVEFLPTPGIGLQPVDEIVHRSVNPHPIAVIIPGGTQHTGIDIIGACRLTEVRRTKSMPHLIANMYTS